MPTGDFPDQPVIHVHLPTHNATPFPMGENHKPYEWPQAERWIPVAERKPDGAFWYAKKGGIVGRAECVTAWGAAEDTDGWPFMRTGNGWRLHPDGITHWLPFVEPKPPAE